MSLVHQSQPDEHGLTSPIAAVSFRYRGIGAGGKDEGSVTQVPEPVSPRYRSRVPECHTATGANVSSMCRDYTILAAILAQFLWANRGQDVGERGSGFGFPKVKPRL